MSTAGPRPGGARDAPDDRHPGARRTAMPTGTHPPVDVAQLLSLAPAGEGDGDGCRSVGPNDINSNGRVFGGQLLGQAVAAALRSVGPERRAGTLQLLFLRGAQVELPIAFEVQRLQDGRRYASRQVAGRQPQGAVFSAHVTAVALPEPAPAPPGPPPAGLVPPERLRTHDALPQPLVDRLAGTNFRPGRRPGIDLRFVDPEAELVPAHAGPARLRYWIRLRQRLSDDPALHAAALAYLSDHWLTYPALAHRLTALPQRSAYVASVNHTMWFLAPCRADGWLYVDARGMDLGNGRAISQARVCTPDGWPVLEMAQECAVSDRV